MSHTTTIYTKNQSNPADKMVDTIFLHNGDYSGDVTIKDSNGKEISVPNEALKLFIAEQIKAQRISEIEQMGAEELFSWVVKDY